MKIQDSKCGNFRRDHSGLWKLFDGRLGGKEWRLLSAHYRLPKNVDKAIDFYDRQKEIQEENQDQ